MSAKNSRIPMTAARRHIAAAVNVLLAFAFLHALSPVAVSAQESATLPQIRLVSSSQWQYGLEVYLCSGPAVASCKDFMRTTYDMNPDLASRGGQRLQINDTGTLAGRPTFLLYLKPGLGGRWVGYEVTVQTGNPVSVVAPASGKIEASGAMAPVNGLSVLQGQLFSIIPEVPAVIDLDLITLNYSPFPQPDVPGISITVRRIK